MSPQMSTLARGTVFSHGQGRGAAVQHHIDGDGQLQHGGAAGGVDGKGLSGFPDSPLHIALGLQGELPTPGP